MAVQARNVMGLESAIDKHHRHWSSSRLDWMFGIFVARAGQRANVCICTNTPAPGASGMESRKS